MCGTSVFTEAAASADVLSDNRTRDLTVFHVSLNRKIGTEFTADETELIAAPSQTLLFLNPRNTDTLLSLAVNVK